MRAAIYNPYWDTLGGGERYTASVADVLTNAGYKVDIQWNNQELIENLRKRFGLKLENIAVVGDINRGREYDVCFWVSDGSIPLLYARKNILHFQIPFKFRKAINLVNRMKFLRINKIVCNSLFTKQFIDASYGIKSDILYPPVDVKQFKTKKKENVILYVGRFSTLTQAKRQDILVEAFKKMYDNGKKNFKLILAGGVEVGVGDYLKQLEESAVGYPIKFMTSPNFKELKDLYSKAAIFWSAAGYDVDIDKNPKNVEHFGITLVEAMAAKCVPIVYAAGGHKEIVKDGVNGYTYKTVDELVRLSVSIINDKTIYRNLAKRAYEDSKQYSYEEFAHKLLSSL